MLRRSLNQSGSLAAAAALWVLAFAVMPPPATDFGTTFSYPRVLLAGTGILVFLGYALIAHRQTLVSATERLFGLWHNRLLALWLVSAVISALLAPDPQLAFMGSTWAQMGVYQLGCCVVLFWIAQTVQLEEKHWQWLGYAVGVMFLLTLAESLGYRPLFWTTQSDAYPAATIGQRGHLAGFFAVTAGVAAYRRAYFWFLLSGLGIALCNNTSALLGFTALGLLALVFEFRQVFLKVLLSLAATILLFLNVSLVNKTFCRSLGHTSTCLWSKDLGSIGSKNFGAVDSMSLVGRRDIWESSIEMIKRRPLLGWGDEQYASRWLSFYSEEKRAMMVRVFTGISLPSKDGEVMIPNAKPLPEPLRMYHPHNTYLEEIQNHGFIGGLLLFSAFVGMVFYNKRILLFGAAYWVYLAAWFLLFSVLPFFSILLGILLADKNLGQRLVTRAKER